MIPQELRREIADLRRPRHWPQMTGRSRDQWQTWITTRLDELAPAFEEYAGFTTWTMREETDDRGRQIFTRAQMLAASRANNAWLRSGRDPEFALDEQTRDAYRAYCRAKDAGRSGKRPPTHRTLQAATLRASGKTLPEIADELGVSLSSAKRYLAHARSAQAATGGENAA